ncbi:hypothetical protein N2152v2_002998 [Parachlorella kessleri]
MPQAELLARILVVQFQLWKQACQAAHKPLACVAPAVDLEEVPGQFGAQQWPHVDEGRTSAFYKRLYYRLSAPQARESLIASAIAASSTDHPQERVDHLLSPIAHSRSLLCYWSSAGSEDENSVEVLSFALAHPLCLVRRIDLRPFKAFFQTGNPVYSPKAVRFRLGGMDCFGPQGKPLPRMVLQQGAERVRPGSLARGTRAALEAAAEAAAAHGGAPAAHQLPAGAHLWEGFGGLGPVLLGPGVFVGAGAVFGPEVEPLPPGPQPGEGQRRRRLQPEAPLLPASTVWQSPVFPMQQADLLQEFEIEPTLCVGGLLQIELLGKVQRQEPDHLLYACLAYVRALGVPLYNFRVVEDPPGQALAEVSAATNADALGSTEAQQHHLTAEQPAADSQPHEQGGQASHSLRLKYHSQDVLLRQGGLVRVSEGGRVWELRRNHMEAHMEDDSMAAGAGLQGGGMVAAQPAGDVDEDMWSGSEVEGDDPFEFAANMPHLDEFNDSDEEPDWENQPFAD